MVCLACVPYGVAENTNRFLRYTLLAKKVRLGKIVIAADINVVIVD